MNGTNNASARMSFEIAKQTLYNAWIGSFNGDAGACWDYVNNRKLSQSEIRLEVELTTGTNIFAFGVTPNQVNTTNVNFITENRLQLQDSLVVAEYGIFVIKAVDRFSTAFKLRTYGNRQDFTAASADALDSTFYSNGNFVMKVNNDVIIPYRGLFNHWYKPQTQETAALGAGSPDDQIRGAEDGCITQEPNLLLIGSKNYVPQIEMKSNLAASDTVPGGASERAVLIFRGVLAQNSTVVN